MQAVSLPKPNTKEFVLMGDSCLLTRKQVPKGTDWQIVIDFPQFKQLDLWILFTEFIHSIHSLQIKKAD